MTARSVISAAGPIVAAITAAGASERMGSPKALLPWRETTILAHIVATLKQAELDPILVITGSGGRGIAGEAARAGARVVHNDGWREGRFSSVQAAARSASSHSRNTSLLLWPVDCPEVRAQTVARLVGSRNAHPANLMPSHRGRSGHPVLLCPDMVRTISSAPRDSNLRELLRRSQIERRLVEVEDPAVIANLNTRAEYERARQAWTREASG